MIKKYFASKTMSNFFSYITLEANMEDKNMDTFEKILEFVKSITITAACDDEISTKGKRKTNWHLQESREIESYQL